jgi:hypothetical protein
MIEKLGAFLWSVGAFIFCVVFIIVPLLLLARLGLLLLGAGVMNMIAILYILHELFGDS